MADGETDAGGAAHLPEDPEQLEAVIAERRAHLADTVDELVGRTKPQALAKQGYAEARSGLVSATHTEDGDLRTERVAAVGGAAALLVLLVIIRTVRRRRSGS